MLSDATALAFRATGLPSAVDPSRNVTLPVALAGETVAVSNVAELKADGFTDDVKLVVVVTCWMVSEYAVELF